MPPLNKNKKKKRRYWRIGLFAGILLPVLAVWYYLANSGSIPAPRGPKIIPLNEPYVWIVSGYPRHIYQHFISLKEFPRSRPDYHHIQGHNTPEFRVSVVMIETTPEVFTWEITVNDDCFTVTDWQYNGEPEQVIRRGPNWAVKVVRYREEWQ